MASGKAEAVLKRDRAFVIADVAGIVVVAWAYMIYPGKSGHRGLHYRRRLMDGCEDTPLTIWTERIRFIA